METLFFETTPGKPSAGCKAKRLYTFQRAFPFSPVAAAREIGGRAKLAGHLAIYGLAAQGAESINERFLNLPHSNIINPGLEIAAGLFGVAALAAVLGLRFPQKKTTKEKLSGPAGI